MTSEAATPAKAEMARSTPSGRPTRCAGHAYVLLLISVAVLAGTAATSLSLGATASRRDAEAQLLAIGEEFHQALRSYGGPTRGHPTTAQLAGPRSLDDLLRDPRVPGVRRHLRRVYADPLTGRREWGLVTDAQGSIIGIHSLAEGQPIQRTGFPAQWAAFEAARSYRDWLFTAEPATAPAGSTLQPPRTTTSFSPTWWSPGNSEPAGNGRAPNAR